MGSDQDPALTPAEADAVRRIAGMMIPADPAYGVPGADDDLIFADIVRSLGRDRDDVVASLSSLAHADRDTVFAFLASGARGAAALSRSVLQCYYRDDRVLVSLGLEARAPFPKGNVLEQGDWSLLDAVRDRKPFWRDDRRVQHDAA